MNDATLLLQVIPCMMTLMVSHSSLNDKQWRSSLIVTEAPKGNIRMAW